MASIIKALLYLKRFSSSCALLLITSCAAIPYFYPKQKSDIKTAITMIDEIAKKHRLEIIYNSNPSLPIRTYKGIPHPSFESTRQTKHMAV
jgi:3'-phosphoadenosine 5'-phosphosulfate sulfotransferase (PAPS reductase)/FAD synthetase